MSNPEDTERRETRDTPPTFRARSLMPSITADDLSTSRAWYHDVLGFHVADEYEMDGVIRSVRLVAGSVQVILNQDDGAKGRDRAKGQGFSFNLDTVQDVDAVASRIEEAGGALESPVEDKPWGVRSFSIQDPDGFLWVISQAL